MSALFIKLLNMSAAGSVLILAVIVLRALLQKAPRWMLCAMWALVAVRLICPVSVASPLSAFRATPSMISESGQVEVFRFAGGSEKPLLAVDTVQIEWPRTSAETIREIPGTSLAITERSRDTYLPPLERAYLLGLTVMLFYALISTLLLRRKVSVSLRQRGNIRVCDGVASPFILGVFRPVIYLPSGLGGEERRYVLAHERAHLRRLDHIWKPLGFLLLSLHWFNPLCWLAYGLFCRDIELACDEKVIRELGKAERAAYSQALLNVSAHRILAACPVAFGETDVKRRVKAVLNYKKPAFWIILAAVLGCIVLVLCFASDPLPKEPENVSPTPEGIDPEPEAGGPETEAIGSYDRSYWAEVERELGSFTDPMSWGVSLSASFDADIPADSLFGPLTPEDYIYGTDAWTFEYNSSALANDPEAVIIVHDFDGRTLRIMDNAEALMIEESDGSITWARYSNATMDCADMIRHLLPWARGEDLSTEEELADRAAAAQRVYSELGSYTLSGLEPLEEKADTTPPFWAALQSRAPAACYAATACFGTEEMSADLRYERVYWNGDLPRPMGSESYSLCRSFYAASTAITDVKVGEHDAFITDINGFAGRRLVWYDGDRDLLFSLVANHVRDGSGAGTFSAEELRALAESVAEKP